MSTNDVGWDDQPVYLLQQSVATNQSIRCDLPNSGSDHLTECSQNEETFTYINWTYRGLTNSLDKCPRTILKELGSSISSGLVDEVQLRPSHGDQANCASIT